MAAKPVIAAGLDAGSARTRCVICALENSRLRCLGAGEVPSSGWIKSRVADPGAMSECVRAAVREAEACARVSVEAVVAGLGGTAIQGLNRRGLYEFGRSRNVEPADMAYAVERACRLQLGEDRCLLQVFPQDFIVDGRAEIRNPRGSMCSRLEANVHVVTTSAYDHQCLVNAVHQASLAVEETVLEAMAAAYASILPEERLRGVALIDVGAHSTGVVVYDGEAVMLASGLPVSGDHFTRDVAWRYKVSYEDAVTIKEQYGCAIRGLSGDNAFIDIPQPDGRPSREAPRLELIETLEARAEELFLYVRREIARAGMEQSLLEGAVLTGGGALMTGMCDMAERVLNCPARNGLVTGIRDWPKELNTAAWTAAAGLAMYSARLKQQEGKQKTKTPGLLSLVFR